MRQISQLFKILTQSPPDYGNTLGLQSIDYAQYLGEKLLMNDEQRQFFDTHEVDTRLIDNNFMLAIYELRRLRSDRAYIGLPIFSASLFLAFPNALMFVAAAGIGAIYSMEMRHGLHRMHNQVALAVEHLQSLSELNHPGIRLRTMKDVTPKGP